MTGKQKCRILNEIRRQIAAQNDIRLTVEECTHKGNCRGTCPKCEWEVRMLEKELDKRRASGRKVVLAGISAGFLLTSCSPLETLKEWIRPTVLPLEGDVPAEAVEIEDPETMFPVETVTETTEALSGEPVLEVEDGEVLPEEVIELAGVSVAGAENEEEYPAAGGVAAVDWEEEELVLEGDVVSLPEDEVQP